MFLEKGKKERRKKRVYKIDKICLISGVVVAKSVMGRNMKRIFKATLRRA